MFISIYKIYRGGYERDLHKHSGCSTTSVQVGGVCYQSNPDYSSLRFQGEVSYEKCCLLRATAKSPMTNSGMQRRQMKKPTTETPVFCGAVIMAMERPAKPRAQLRDTQLIGLRSWIASPSKK